MPRTPEEIWADIQALRGEPDGQTRDESWWTNVTSPKLQADADLFYELYSVIRGTQPPWVVWSVYDCYLNRLGPLREYRRIAGLPENP